LVGHHSWGDSLRLVAIPYGRQTIDEADVQAVIDVLRGDWLTQGPAVRSFEEAFATACGAPYAVSFSSGTAALHGSAFAAGIGPGDHVITSGMTFAASANCAAYLGATPLFADIERETWNMSAETVAAVATGRTRAVIPVHFAGLPAPTEAIRAAVGPEVRIVEDAAHALGAFTPDERIGSCTHSDMAVFSLHPVKAIAAGEGGVVTTRDPELRDRLEAFRNHGFTRAAERLQRNGEGGWYYEQQALGFNYRLSDIHSALAESQLAKLESFIERRNAIAGRYREAFAALEPIELPPEASTGSRHAYHLFVVRARDGAAARRRLYDELRGRGVRAQVHYVPVYWHPWYRERFGYEPGLCPEAERYYEGCLSIPCFPALSEAEQQQVIEDIAALATR
jgi:UDP-4-amino-4,6-dideoxy-N-acetyl-beta-L-altrosamine transaminase